MRLEDESAVIRDAFSAEYTDLAVFVTDFGGTSIPMFLLAVLFWLGRRRDTALVFSYAFAGLALLVALKSVLGLPRPPESAFLVPLDDDPYGFPSGHSFAAVVVYGGLLSAYDPARKRLAAAGVALLVTLISLSRVVLGYHYLGDVIAGAALGVAFLYAIDRLTDGDPRRGFAIAVVLSIAAVVVTGASQESLLGLGGAIGGVIASTRLETLPALRSRLEGAVLGVVGVGFVAFVTALESTVASAFELALIPLYAVLVLGILLVPGAIGYVENGVLER